MAGADAVLVRGHEMPHPKKAAMLAALAKTGNVSASARAADIDRRTHYRWLRTDSEYAQAVETALEDAVDVLEAVARQRAIHGSDTLLIFLLKGHRPEKYRDQYYVKHSGRMEVDPTPGWEILRDPEVTRVLDEFQVSRARRLEAERMERDGPLSLPPPRG